MACQCTACPIGFTLLHEAETENRRLRQELDYFRQLSVQYKQLIDTKADFIEVLTRKEDTSNG